MPFGSPKYSPWAAPGGSLYRSPTLAPISSRTFMTEVGIGSSALFFHSVSSNVSSIEVRSGALLAAFAARSFCWIWASGTNWSSTLIPGFFAWNSGMACCSVMSLMLRRSVNQAVSLISLALVPAAGAGFDVDLGAFGIGPIQVEELASRLIRPLVGMSAEVVALGL